MSETNHAINTAGYAIAFARSASEALRRIAERDFALVLLDAGMAAVDVCETARTIHSHPRSAMVPIIFVTAEQASEDDRLRAYQAGAVDFISAPIVAAILQAKLAVFAGLAKQKLEMQSRAEHFVRLNGELQQQRKRNLEQLNEHKLVEDALRQSREELRQLASYQDRVKEDERKRIAREIHDDLGQNLLALRIDVSMLYARTGNTHPKLNRKVHAVLDQIDVTMKAMRSIINNLRPTVLDLGLNAAIEWQVKDFQRRSGIECHLHMQGRELVLDDSRATALFRILQESLNNVLRHAQATRADIKLQQNGDTLFMQVADNGIGIFPGCRRNANSFGLVGIRERTGALGGRLVIDSGQHKGTTLIVSIPVESEGADGSDEGETRTDVVAELSMLRGSDGVLALPVSASVENLDAAGPRGKVGGIA
ncbi:histidine kinase [Noviherbaspirillum cavernae]|uniref:ATP-binding response regulator n=1 Tax=Noviherbaspirillum cavernae TaxID=2320862 RepID=UPI001F5B9EE0|nr:histidine kinase [Noviherbaspirillum cavernae]